MSTLLDKNDETHKYPMYSGHKSLLMSYAKSPSEPNIPRKLVGGSRFTTGTLACHYKRNEYKYSFMMEYIALQKKKKKLSKCAKNEFHWAIEH